MKHYFSILLMLISTVCIFSQPTSPIRINQIGYELNGPKYAIYQGEVNELSSSETFTIETMSGDKVYDGSEVSGGDTVTGWDDKIMQNDGRFYFWVLNFSDFKTKGSFIIKCNGQKSFEFEIDENLYLKVCLEEQLNCYEKMRYLGEEDKNLLIHGQSQTVDIFGGYKEASGDASKHLSHLQYANYMGGQENPMLTWVLLRTYEQNSKIVDELSLKTKLFDEVAFGADYLIRSQGDPGWFYSTIFNFWKDDSIRLVCAYEAGLEKADEFVNIQVNKVTDDYKSAFRAGGGIAIAALAKASKMGVAGKFSSSDYLQAAIKGYDHLKANFSSLCYNGKENIIDDYCALMAAIELYKATDNNDYKTDAGKRVENILKKQQSDGWFITEDGGTRPYYHAAEEGFPLIALMYFMEIDNSKDSKIKATLQKSIDWYYKISVDINNPFNCARLYAKPYNTQTRSYSDALTSFFIPKYNETGYWYQGENARLASMTTALLSAAKVLDSNYKFGSDKLTTLAMDQFNWVLGKNPYEVCMLYGFGTVNNPDYNPDYNSCNTGKEYRGSINGGICNGISSGARLVGWEEVEHLEWAPADGESWTDWRYLEQWLPHEFWYTLAMSTISSTIEGSTDIKDQGFAKKSKPVSLNINTVNSNGKIQISINGHSSNSTLKIFNLKGCTVQSIPLNQNMKQISIDSKDLPAGLHFVELRSGTEQVVRTKVFSLR